MRAAISARLRRGLKRVLPDRAIDAVRAVREAFDEDTWAATMDQRLDPGLRRLAYWPGGRQNPYLELLYSRCPEVGFTPAPLTRFSDLDSLPSDSVFHLHWTRGAQLGASTRDEAVAMTATYLAPIESFVARGGTFLWSVHEETPHDIEFADVEAELRTRLAELATGIHLLHASTTEAVSTSYALPAEKTFVVEHPLYTGYYPNFVGRAAARRRLGVGDRTTLVVGFGALRPYKAFPRLIRLASPLASRTGRPVHVLIAGPTMRHADTDELEELAAGRDDVTVSIGSVPVTDVQLLFKAADVVALPYRRVMNSGVLMLALTFGRVCVAPHNPVIEGFDRSGLVELFDADSDESLLDALVRAADHDHPDELPEDFVRRYDPFVVAGEFAGHLATIAGNRTDT